MHATLPLLKKTTFPAIDRRRLDTLQVNLGYKCNQSCVHCHVNAGPTRTEMMSREVADEVLAFLRAARLPTLDITGGAPELNAHFRHLVISARWLGIHVMDRCNLTILEQPGQDDLARWVGCSREAVCKALRLFRDRGLPRTSRRSVTILDMAGLKSRVS
jgi:radical SAM/Cys-rich protein